MQRTLFIAVAALGLVVGALLFLVLRPRPSASALDPAQNPRFVIGDPQAKVTVVDFSNYLCSHCRDHANEVFPFIKRDYIDTGKVRYIFRDFPFTGQENVIRAGEAAACAADSNLYVEYHEALFRAQLQWAGLSGEALDRYFADLAGQVGMAPATFLQCLKSGSKRAGVLADQKLALELGLTGTPSFFVNGERYTGQRPYSSWREILDRALAGQSPSQDEGGQSSPYRP
ncbi:Disulfide bond formation protein D [Meiothermus luteus]|jgi:protein-disulfide isomerase|uniref:Disulfide bond formation protein D n=1 Tax=Meiothermus luteus TaxID=2026184 RepID=A0A399ELB0_9DEIN|nr:DsbA family protein [Meiothermus luteus]RIH83192.1 Disulfide bond formation protein D [Meiothermus luteus]RMH56092.1 MAG: DsbA family protein [Deinococcota bacterium]